MKTFFALILIGVFSFSLFGTSLDVFAQNNENSPLKQLKQGVSLEQIKCNENLEPLYKENTKVICVTPETKKKLIDRNGWLEKISLKEPSKIDPIEKFPYSFEKEVFTQMPDSLPKFDFTSNELIKFETEDEVFSFLQEIRDYDRGDGFVSNTDDVWLPAEPMPEPEPEPEPEPAPEFESLELQQRQAQGSPSHGGIVSFDEGTNYSTTNIQVEYVDEPDYLKNDGKYVYLLNQNTLTIVDAFPPQDAKIILKVALDIEPQHLENMFLNDDHLVILHYGSSQIQTIAEFDFAPYPMYLQNTMVSVLDVSDKTNPVLVSQHSIDGAHNDSRMIDDVVYLITTNWINYEYPVIPRVISEAEIILPDIFRFPNIEDNYNFNTIAAIEVSSGDLINSETFLMGYSNSIYVSTENLYITYEKTNAHVSYEQYQRERFFSVIVPLLPEEAQDQINEINTNPGLDPRQKWRDVSVILQDAYNQMSKENREQLFLEIQTSLEEYDSKFDDRQRTVIHKINLDDGNLKYITNGEVPGNPLNQFSMDEYQGSFRIATTSQSFDRGELSNNVYILDENLEVTGKLEGIAPEERIFSSRFMGDRLYLVTFQQIDPFFVIDLSGKSPKILGELKIPGFSNFLQAYDDDHIIGIGRDTELNKNGGVRQLGVKVAMFDVSDFDNPKEKDVIIIGDSRTDSEITHDHKALLLDKEKNILSIPIKTSISSLENLQNVHDRYNRDKYWYGFYVYGFDEDGFVSKGEILHHQWQHDYNKPYMKSRSFYINDALYTVMDGSLKINDLDSLDEINSINLGYGGRILNYVR